MSKRKPVNHNYPADLVWAAACAAHRVNGGYRKYPQVVDGRIDVPANRDLVHLYLNEPDHITAADRAQAQICRQVLSNSVTMRMLKDSFTQWDILTADMLALDTVNTDYEISVITTMPKSYQQVVSNEDIDNRLAHCDSAPVGHSNERVTVSGEVVRCVYSNRFNTHYVTMITDRNQQVFFAYREALKTGQHIGICGRVKRHADRATQLGRVKLVEQEAV